jgi:hypothetical protein
MINPKGTILVDNILWFYRIRTIDMVPVINHNCIDLQLIKNDRVHSIISIPANPITPKFKVFGHSIELVDKIN